jgi:S1-C subfamily serine protease/Flp pilus assembly protein TadD
VSAAGAVVQLTGHLLRRYSTEILAISAKTNLTRLSYSLPQLGREHAVRYYRFDRGIGQNMRILYAFVLVIASATAAEAADTSAGSGVVIGTQGEILTNSHVVEGCAEITLRFTSGNSETAALVARDERNDLAVIRAIRANISATSVATFREGTPVRAGDAAVALGYPLSGLLATTANLSVGNVSALAGLRDDSRYLQISAPVQPGNSGGPLLDTSGHLIGIVTAKLNAVRIAKFTGDIPQNVNFALKAEVARTFLDSKGIAYRKAPSDQQLSAADVGDIARPFTVHIRCKQDGLRSAAVPTMSSPSQVANQEFNRQIRLCTDLRIDSCTALIQSRQVIADRTLAKVFQIRGQAYFFKRDFTRAISDLTEAIRLNPADSGAFGSRGITYSMMKEYGRGMADFNEAIRLNPKDAGAFSGRGGTYRGMGEYSRAIADYNQAIWLNPKYAEAFSGRGLTYYLWKEYDRAIADLNEAIRLDPSDALSYRIRNDAYYYKQSR